jgi:hypothetical protein
LISLADRDIYDYSGGYDGGRMVDEFSGDDPSLWTSGRWSVDPFFDLAFTADFTLPTPVPEPSSFGAIGALALAFPYSVQIPEVIIGR